ncbi:LuxR family transcriptional regulator [Halovulum sp. GXIMD14793]
MATPAMTLEDFFRAANAAAWSEDLWRVVVRYFQSHGIDMVIYHHLPPLGAPDEGRPRIAADGVPIDWLRPYIRQKLYRVDPIPLHALRSEEPFFWDQIRDLTPLEPQHKEFLIQFEAAGLGDGLAIQVFGPGGRNGYFGLGISGPRPDSDVISVYQCVCQTAHQKYCLSVRSRLPAPPRLSERELEILEWVARGKSNSVIADIVGISAHTVDAYMRRVFLKLGTTDRITAAIRGLGTGLITGNVA